MVDTQRLPQEKQVERKQQEILFPIALGEALHRMAHPAIPINSFGWGQEFFAYIYLGIAVQPAGRHSSIVTFDHAQDFLMYCQPLRSRLGFRVETRISQVFVEVSDA